MTFMTTHKPCRTDARLRHPACLVARNIARGLLIVAAGVPLLQPAMAWRGGAVKVDLEGTVVPKCGLNADSEASRALHIDNLLKAVVYQVKYNINCNAPFNYTIQSQNGALILDSGITTDDAITRLPYDIHIHIPTDGAAIEDRCSSESIISGRITCLLHDSGMSVAIGGQAILTLTLPQRETSGSVLPGRYVDRLTFTVNAQL